MGTEPIYDWIPDEMEATICGDWIDKAISTANVMECPEPVRSFVLDMLRGAAHYCRKYDFVQVWGFQDGELELITALAGPYPVDEPTRF